MAHLINKCHREVILEYFGEDTSQIETSGVCCDVCHHKSSKGAMMESAGGIKVVIEANMVLAESGEKKVRNYVRGRIFV